MGPLIKAFIIKHLYIVRNDKRHNIIAQTLFEQNKPPNTAVPVLKGMYSFKLIMEI